NFLPYVLQRWRLPAPMHGILPPLPHAVKERPQHRKAVIARVSARSSVLAGLDDLDRRKREVALAAVSVNGIALQWAPERLRKDKEIAMAAVANAGQALKYVNKELQSDRDVVLAAIRQNGLALLFASPRLQRDKELVLEACQRDGSALHFACDALRDDADCKIAAGTATTSVCSSARCTVDSSRSRFVASTYDGRWPSLTKWSRRPYLAATARTVDAEEAPRRSTMRSTIASAWQGPSHRHEGFTTR
ncbi:unnamed protein product, partial [Effrenium voratum]